MILWNNSRTWPYLNCPYKSHLARRKKWVIPTHSLLLVKKWIIFSQGNLISTISSSTQIVCLLKKDRSSFESVFHEHDARNTFDLSTHTFIYSLIVENYCGIDRAGILSSERDWGVNVLKYAVL